MEIVVTKNKKTNIFIKSLSLVNDIKQVRKEAKKQLLNEIIEHPETLVAYKDLEMYSIANINEDMEITKSEIKLMFTFKELLDEIIEQLTKEKK